MQAYVDISKYIYMILSSKFVFIYFFFYFFCKYANLIVHILFQIKKDVKVYFLKPMQFFLTLYIMDIYGHAI